MADPIDPRRAMMAQGVSTGLMNLGSQLLALGTRGRVGGQMVQPPNVMDIYRMQAEQQAAAEKQAQREAFGKLISPRPELNMGGTGQTPMSLGPEPAGGLMDLTDTQRQLATALGPDHPVTQSLLMAAMEPPEAPKPTTLMQNIEAGGLVPGTPEYQSAMLEAVRRPGTSVSIRQMGAVPPHYRAIYDEAGNPVRLEPLPGGKAAQEAEEAAKAEEAKGAQARKYADIVTEDVDRVLDLADKFPVTGFFSVAQHIPGTPQADAAALLSTIRSNVGFGRLQEMRDSSPTGGALGPVSDMENRLMQATLGNLEQSQTEEQFRYNLERVKDTYLDIIHGPGQRPKPNEGETRTYTPQEYLNMSDDELMGIIRGGS